MVDHFSERRWRNEGIAYVYFKYQDNPDTQKPLRILGSIISQLITQLAPHLPLPQKVTDLYDELSQQKRWPTQDQLYTTLVEVSKLFTHVYLVFDALDECRREVRSVLLPMFRQMGSDRINVFMTSRPLADIQRLLAGVVNIKLSARQEDIVTYLEGKIANLREFKPSKAGLLEKYKNRVIAGIVGCADEMWVFGQSNLYIY